MRLLHSRDFSAIAPVYAWPASAVRFGLPGLVEMEELIDRFLYKNSWLHRSLFQDNSDDILEIKSDGSDEMYGKREMVVILAHMAVDKF